MFLSSDSLSLSVSLPVGLFSDFDACFKLFKPDFGGFKLYFDNFVYILGKIYEISTKNPRFKNLDKVPISSTILMHELGRHYRKYLDYLILHGFVETDNYYIVSDFDKKIEGKCKCYSLGKYRSIQKSEKITIAPKSVIGHYIRWRKKIFSEVSNDQLLSKLFDMVQKFRIDTSEAESYLRKLQETDNSITNEWIDNELMKCDKINDKSSIEKMMFIVKDPYNRVHTNITNLSKIIRENFLYLGDEPVKSIDIVSSQASLLYLLMKKERNLMDEIAHNPHITNDLPEDGILVGTDVRDKYVNRKNSYSGEQIPIVLRDEYRVSKLGHKTYSDAVSAVDEELEKMKIILESGIYEYFQQQWFIATKKWLSRNVIKKKWITFIFGEVHKTCHTMRGIWNLTFPTLTKMINHFKLFDYRFLAHNLQRTEADLVFNKVCPLIDENLGIPYATVHDSLIVPSSAYDITKTIFSDVLIENGIVTGVK